jgi:methylated-DNA-[protein]-cysteine S-methyltransferase
MKSTSPFRYSTMTTPLGRFSVAVDRGGALAGAAFGGAAALRARLHGGPLARDPAATSAARRQLREWFLGARRGFSLKLSPAGTPFQLRVWRALARIPYGRTLSYGDLARSVRSSPRAVGRANATNPICLVIPCHRVIGSNGALTGYAFGERRKARLLGLEGRGRQRAAAL